MRKNKLPRQGSTHTIMKSNSALPYVVVIFLLLVTGETYHLYIKEHRSVVRLTDNLAAVQKENVYFKARNGDQAVKIQSQELTIKEIRATVPAVIASLKNLYIAPRQLSGFIQGASTSENHITTTLRDSVITDTLRVSVIDYSDKWFAIKGIIQDKKADLVITSCDTITAVSYLSRRPRPWLWIFGGRRVPETIISNKNPNNKITIKKSIQVKK